MHVSRRSFIRGGVSAFTVTLAAPEFLCDLALAQGARSRNLVVLYLAGGNDSLNTVVSYRDPFYYSRRPTIAVPAAQVLQIGTDTAGNALGLHPATDRLRDIFNQGGSRSSSARDSELEPIAFPGRRHLGHCDPNSPSKHGMARPLSRDAAAGSVVGLYDDTRFAARADVASDLRCRRFPTRAPTASPARTPATRR
jgi:uncharacterized protein (DUF1501 family)